MKEKSRMVRRVISLLIIWVILISFGTTAFAAQPKSAKAIIKVAFYPLEGFFEYDDSGNPCGYGVDYLNELKKYANIEWEYVPVDSWEGIKPLMQNGEVDVRMPVSEPTTPSEVYDYTTEPMLMSYHAIMTLKDNSDVYYQDYDTIKNMKIAVSETLLQRTGVGGYLDSIGATNNLVLYDDYNDCRAALESGAVDALISNVMDLTEDMKILDKFSVVDNYITTLKNNPCFKVINDAMTQMKLENPSFQTELYQQYYPERAWEPLTKCESEYVAETNFLTVAVYPNRKPVSYIDMNGDYKGIAIDMANLLSQKIGIPFRYISITTNTQPEMLDKADLVMPVPDIVDSKECFVTQSILDTEILMAVHPGVTELEEGMRVGVLNTTPGILKTIEELKLFNIVCYDTNRDAFNALQSGKIDAFANSSYVINWMLQNPRYSNLVTLRYQSFPLAFSICGNADDTMLQSLLSKAIHQVSDEERTAIVQNGTKLMMDDFTLADRFYVYRFQLIGISTVALLLALFVIVYSHTRSRYYRNIQEGNRKLEKANTAKSEFLSRMSHDMRTPMNGILGITSLLHDRTDPEEIREDVKQIEMSAKYLLSLINDTLDMSKIESGRMELHPEPIGSEDLFRNVIATANILASQKGVQLKMEFPPIEHGGWVPVMADAARVEQIFVNLISNAIKFTPKGGTVTLHMDTVDITEDTVQDRYVVFDTGIGMSEEFQKHLFEPFSQEGRNNDYIEGGTGLGLAIVKQIIDLMGGSIQFESRENEGTTFTIELTYPRYHGELSKQLDVPVDSSVLNGKRVLLCEDHPVNAQIAMRLLNKKGVIVESAENGQVGVAMFRKNAPRYYDAILMDIRMPVMDGIEAAKEIRATTGRKDAASIPIIAMTANAFDDDKEKTKAAGMNAHLAKPVEPNALYETLSGLIEGK